MFGKTMKARLTICAAVAALALIFGVGFLSTRFPSSLRPICDIALSGAIEIRMQDIGSTNYPNVEGDAQRSLAVFHPTEDPGPSPFTDFRFKDYRYIPGLTPDDPRTLILFYKARKTPFRWHSESIPFWRVPFVQLKWSIIDPGLAGDCHGGSSWLDTSEFKRRLQLTFDFLKENNRPYWTNVVAEHTAFLNSLKDE